MGQFVLYFLFFAALLVGAFTYFVPAQKSIDPMKFVMEGSGYDSVEVQNRKKEQQFNMSTNRGLIKIRGEMDNLAVQQNKFLDTIKDEQQMLNSSAKDADDVMWELQQKGGTDSKDILQLQALAAEMKDEQRLLVAHGQDLIVLNDQLTKSREWAADQMSIANINNETSLRTLQQRTDMLKDQASSFFEKVTQHNQEVRDRMNKIQDQLNDLANNAAYDSVVQQQTVKDRIGRMLDKEHEDMLKLTESEDRSRDLLKDAQQNLADSNDALSDELQKTKDKIEDERQRAQDQEWIIQQREADQKQRMEDLQNR